MKIGLFCPAYHGQIHIETSYAWMAEDDACERRGWQLFPYYRDSTFLTVSRNYALRVARENKLERLVMWDADISVPSLARGQVLHHLEAALHRFDAAVAGLAVVLRNMQRVNCEPAQPGEVYEVEKLGTGIVLIDVARVVAAVDPPWFGVRTTTDGSGVDEGEDCYFVRRCREAGLRVVCDYTLPTMHLAAIPLSTEPALR